MILRHVINSDLFKEIFTLGKRGVTNTTEGVALSELLKHTYQMVQFICAQDKGFYVMLIVPSESDIGSSDIPIVNEYLDVFPSDITSLPQEREVEFSIALILGAEPVSIAPYRMSPLV